MKVAVFGAAGYIGRHLVARLGRDRATVIPISSAQDGVFDPVSGLLLDSFELSAGTQAVIYLSQSPRFRQMPAQASHLWGVNVLSAMRAANCARKVGARRFIYASTGNVYAPSFAPLTENQPLRRDDWYALSKIHAEEGLALFDADMHVLSARIFGVYGPGQADRLVPNLIQSIRNGLPVTLAGVPGATTNDGGLRVSLCFIDDVVNTFVQLLRLDTIGAVNVAGPDALSICDMAQAIGEHIGRHARFEVAVLPRQFDLIADVAKLVQLCQPQFTSFDKGLRQVLGQDMACQP